MKSHIANTLPAASVRCPPTVAQRVAFHLHRAIPARVFSLTGMLVSCSAGSLPETKPMAYGA